MELLVDEKNIILSAIVSYALLVRMSVSHLSSSEFGIRDRGSSVS